MKKYAWILALVFVLSTGCVKRSITVQTEPPQADITINGEPVGKSPVTVPFVFYGQYEIRAELKGYKAVKQIEKLHAPAYEYFPADFVSEVALPAKIKDQRTFTYKLEKFEITPETNKELIERANQTRKEYHEKAMKPKTKAKAKPAPAAPAAEKKPPTKNFGHAVSAKPAPANTAPAKAVPENTPPAKTTPEKTSK